MAEMEDDEEFGEFQQGPTPHIDTQQEDEKCLPAVFEHSIGNRTTDQELHILDERQEDNKNIAQLLGNFNVLPIQLADSECSDVLSTQLVDIVNYDVLPTHLGNPVTFEVLSTRLGYPVKSHMLSTRHADPVNWDILSTQLVDPVNFDVLSTQFVHLVNSDVLENHFDDPGAFDGMSTPHLGDPIEFDILSTQLVDLVNCDVMSTQLVDPVNIDVQSTTLVDPVNSDVTSFQFFDQGNADVTPIQFVDQVSTDVTSMLLVDQDITDVASIQFVDQISTDVASMQLVDQVSTDVISMQLVDQVSTNVISMQLVDQVDYERQSPFINDLISWETASDKQRENPELSNSLAMKSIFDDTDVNEDENCAGCRPWMPDLPYQYWTETGEEGADRYSQEWERCLRSCWQVLSEANSFLGSITSSSICNEVLKSIQGSVYVSGLVEIYGIICRVATSMQSTAISTRALEQTLRNIDIVWNNLTAFLAGASLLTKQDSLDFTHRELKSALKDSQNQVCGVCLLHVDSAPLATSCCGDTNSGTLTHFGRQYHATCANFWVNRVDQTLPTLTLPNLLENCM